MLLIEPTKNEDEYSYKHLIELAHVLGFKYSIQAEYWKLAKTALVVLKEILVKDHHALKSYARSLSLEGYVITNAIVNSSSILNSY